MFLFCSCCSWTDVKFCSGPTCMPLLIQCMTTGLKSRGFIDRLPVINNIVIFFLKLWKMEFQSKFSDLSTKYTNKNFILDCIFFEKNSLVNFNPWIFPTHLLVIFLKYFKYTCIIIFGLWNDEVHFQKLFSYRSITFCIRTRFGSWV